MTMKVSRDVIIELGLSPCNPGLCRNTMCGGWIKKNGSKTNHVVPCRFAGHCSDPGCKGVGFLQNGFHHLYKGASDTMADEEYRQFKPMNRNLGAFVKGNVPDEKTSTSSSTCKSDGESIGKDDAPSYHVRHVSAVSTTVFKPKSKPWADESSDEDLGDVQNEIARSEEMIVKLRAKAEKLVHDANIKQIKKDEKCVLDVKDSLDKIDTLEQFEKTIDFWIDMVKRIVPADDYNYLVQHLTRELELDISGEDSI